MIIVIIIIVKDDNNNNTKIIYNNMISDFHTNIRDLSLRTRARVFISQQDEKSQPALLEVLKLSQKPQLPLELRDCDEALKQVLDLHGLAA